MAHLPLWRLAATLAIASATFTFVTATHFNLALVPAALPPASIALAAAPVHAAPIPAPTAPTPAVTTATCVTTCAASAAFSSIIPDVSTIPAHTALAPAARPPAI